MKAGMISTYGIRKISPIFNKNFGLTDTCGIFNLHEIPGLLGGIISKNYFLNIKKFRYAI
jgi:ammonium transporter Rh